MYALFLKELKSFIGSLVGYIVIIIFLVLVSLFLWIFPGESNLLESGYASLTPFFYIAPWVFLFLIPAITMRTFAEEKKSGTLELIITKPISKFEIVLAKFFANIALVLIALIPTLTFVYSIYHLGAPVGNLDTGAIMGSFIGLLFLSAIFVSIGVFTSSISSSQITSFILAVFFCFFFYIGFDYISNLDLFGKIDNLIIKIGIDNHYSSISRGVVDSRDLIYFVSVSAFFLILTAQSIKHSAK